MAAHRAHEHDATSQLKFMSALRAVFSGSHIKTYKLPPLFKFGLDAEKPRFPDELEARRTQVA